jgi:hypothetical protein
MCQPSERQFYQQKMMFSAERNSLDAQTLREVAQKVRGCGFSEIARNCRHGSKPKGSRRRRRIPLSIILVFIPFF